MKQGHEPFVSINTLHQLHILIFILAGVHVVYSCLTMVLSLTKVSSKISLDCTYKSWAAIMHRSIWQPWKVF